MRKIGINFQRMPEMELEEQVKFISDLGFRATFTDMMKLSNQDYMANLFAKNNLAYETIHGPFNHINDIWLDTEGGEAMYQELHDCIERCGLLQIPHAIIHMSSGLTPPAPTDLGRERFARLIEYAQKKNVKLAFENLRKLAHLAWMFEDYAENDTVKFCWDCGHQTCYTPGIDFMPLFQKKLGCLHMHDNYGVLNQDSHLLPFDGVIDFDKAAKLIGESGFEGTMMLEVFKIKGGLYDSMTAQEYYIRAAEAAKKLAQMSEMSNV